MPKKPQPHPYADRLSFERILLLIATLIQYPGIGSPDSHESSSQEKHHEALEAVQTQLRQVATAIGINFPDGYPALATIRKDLQTLRDYGILDKRMYRWGYYLGTGAMSKEQLKVTFNALASLAHYQGDPQVRQIYQTLERRLRGLNLEEQEDFFYPVRAYLNRPIIYTDPDEMIAKGKNRHSLCHCLETVENAIAQGQIIELYRHAEPYQQQTGYLQVYPLQLFYHDIAWYLLYEEARTPHFYAESEIQHLAVERLDRFKDHCRIIQKQGRGQKAQLSSLKLAQKLMNIGWGIFLGEPQEQQLERLGQLPLEEVKIRFFPPATTFILEGECRHPSQRIRPGKKNNSGEYDFVDYIVKLPRRSFHELTRWVYRYMGNAQVLSPQDLVEEHRQAAQALAARYS
jgi:predicted DNA-binding transcriptional regulator YafY